MPIPAQALLEATEPLPNRILKFLRANPTEAFTDMEILAGVEGYDTNSVVIAMLLSNKAEVMKAMLPVKLALKHLVLQKSVISGNKGGTLYWMAAPK